MDHNDDSIKNSGLKRTVVNKRLESMESTIDKYFNCTDTERAAFEAGIKLGTLFHQFIGIPISSQNASIIEKAMQESISTQPYVTDVKIKIISSDLGDKKHEFDYASLTGNMLDVNLTIKFKDSLVKAKLNFIPELNYPLMYISSVE